MKFTYDSIAEKFGITKSAVCKKIAIFTDELKKQKFSVDGTRYQWMTLDQMWNDKAIKECNTDIVGYVRDIYQ